MLNSLYYTFSTVAQSLAGAIGLLGAFVLFRLQSLRGEIERLAHQVMTVVGMVQGSDQAQELFRRGRYSELLAHLETVSIPSTTYQCTDERVLLPLLLDKRDALVARFRLALYLTVGLVLASVAVLILAEAISHCPIVAFRVFGAGFLWLAACLAAFVVLMRDSLQ